MPQREQIYDNKNLKSYTKRRSANKKHNYNMSKFYLVTVLKMTLIIFKLRNEIKTRRKIK